MREFRNAICFICSKDLGKCGMTCKRHENHEFLKRSEFYCFDGGLKWKKKKKLNEMIEKINEWKYNKPRTFRYRKSSTGLSTEFECLKKEKELGENKWLQ